jgi:hypothetical protein
MDYTVGDIFRKIRENERAASVSVSSPLSALGAHRDLMGMVLIKHKPSSSVKDRTKSLFSSKSQLRYFGASLKDILSSQAANDISCQAPLLQIFLQNQIRAHGGCQAEGIFRISVEASEIAHVKEQIEKDDFRSEIKNPHASAVVLKKWLRELNPPLIPSDMYKDALKIGRLSELDPYSVVSFVMRLPEGNRIVLEELIILLRQISSAENVKLTKMTADNLSIVFSPNLLKNPSKDPAAQLQSAAFETQFVKYLIQGVSAETRDPITFDFSSISS